MSGKKNEIVALVFRQGYEHGDLKKEFLFGAIVCLGCGFGDVFEVFLQMCIPFLIPFLSAGTELEFAGFVLEAFDEVDEIEKMFRRWRFGYRNDALASAPDEDGAA